ncbi:MAG: hypothetical protein RIE58_06505 [Vicingaceae bacterium]
MLIPFDRFEFHTEFKRSYINQLTGMQNDEYFFTLTRVFSDAFVLGDFEHVRYQLISVRDYKNIESLLKFEMNNAQGHYAANLSSIHTNLYQKLLQDYQCEFVLVFSWYRIFEVTDNVKLSKARKYGQYSEHMVDFDFFDDQQNLITFGANQRFRVVPAEENMKYRGLRISDLREAYRDLAGDISRQILPIR